MAALSVPAVPLGLRRVRATFREIPMTTGYALLLLLGDLVMALLPTSDRLAIAHATSTNITHLAVDPLLVLPASAFVDLGNGWAWVPLSLLLLGGLERAVGVRRAIIIAFGAHVVATLLSEGLLLMQVAWHVMPRSDLDVLDVGPSYLILAALSACLVVGSWRLRAAAGVAGLIVVPGLLSGLTALDMSAVGHLSSLVLGFGLAVGLRNRQPTKASDRLRDAAAKVAATTAATTGTVTAAVHTAAVHTAAVHTAAVHTAAAHPSRNPVTEPAAA